MNIKRSSTYLISYLLLILVFYGKVLGGLVSDWWNDPNFSHGFIVLPVVSYLILDKREVFRLIDFHGNWTGMAIVAVAALSYHFGVVCSVEYFKGLSLLLWLYGSIIVLLGFPLFRAILFPMLYLLFMIPLPYLIYDRIASPLRMWTSSAAAFLLNIVGISAYQEGNIISLATIQLDVVDACSGIRSLVSFAAIAVLLAYIRGTRFYLRLFVVLSAIPIAVVTNTIRLFLAGVFAGLGYTSITEGFFHTFSGWGVFLIGFLMLLSVSWISSMMEKLVSTR